MKWRLVIIAITQTFYIQAQNLDKIGSGEEVKVTGVLAFSSIAYAQSGLASPSREPFTWYASGSVNLSILDIALPFTYTYSNQGGKFTQPFNRTSFNPSYKWAKAYIGITSMNFSRYTLSGHLFAGAGLELSPGNWKIQIMSGRLNKAIDFDVESDNLNEIVYKRFGYGLKIGYQKNKYGGSVTLFKANDIAKSLTYIPLNTPIKPQDNVVISLDGKAELFSGLILEGEYAISGLTQNTLLESELTKDSRKPVYALINGNESTGYFNAYKTSLKYNLSFMSLAFQFEHIDPGYKTLGGYFFNNDLENYTFTPTFSLFKKKLNLALNTGYQLNNLSNDKAGTTKRWVGSINGSFAPNQNVVVNGNYSNFSTFTKNRPTTDPFYFVGADTMNFYQVAQTASGMISYNFGTDSIRHGLQGLYTFQVATNLTGAIETAGAFGTNLSFGGEKVPTKTHITNLSYACQFIPMKAGMTIAGNLNQTIFNDQLMRFLGPTLSLQKALWNKLANLSIGTTYNRQFSNGSIQSNILNHRIGFTLNPKSKNSKKGKATFSANANYLQRFAIQAGESNINEFNLFLNLNFSI